MAPVLLLDVMDTLVVDPFHAEIPGFFGVTLEQLWRQKHHSAWVNFELGRLSAAEYAASMFSDGREVDAVALAACVGNAYRFVDGIPELLADLTAARAEMHALSNYPEWYLLIEERLRLSRWIAWSFVSCRTGLRKPDAAAYLEAARSLGRAPEECVFVDDREKNCQAARDVGMTAVRFESASELRAELVRLGVLSD